MNRPGFRGTTAALYLALASILWSPGFYASAAEGDLVVIANPGLSLETIEHKDLQRIYLGKKTQWDDGTTIVTVMTKSGALHDEFIEDYLDRSVQRYATYWRQMLFTGKGVPPRSFAAESDLVEFVARTPGSVGFASASTDVSGVKILLVD